MDASTLHVSSSSATATPHAEDADGLLLLNPGSATDRRRQPRCTLALLTIADGQPSAEILPML